MAVSPGFKQPGHGTSELVITEATEAIVQDPVPFSSWLFIRGPESIWVERPFGTTLIVAGPGSYRERRDFIDGAAVDAFQAALAERLAADGWFLWAHDRDRRSDTDRRNTTRATPDRRKVLQFPKTPPTDRK